MPESFDDILAKYLALCDSAETVDNEQFIANHPEFAEELREYFDTAERIESVARQQLVETISPDGATDCFTQRRR